MMKTPNLYANFKSNTFSHVEPHFRNNKVDVLYVTDRKPMRNNTLKYGFGRSASMAYGSYVVEFGKEITWDDLVKESLSKKRSLSLDIRTFKVAEHGRFPDTPLPLIASQGDIIIEPSSKTHQEEIGNQFQEEIQNRLALTSRKEAYIYIHGYHSPFEDSSFVIAQLWHFLGRKGVPIAYSWPAGSPGIFRGYQYDRESGEFTIYHLKEFLRILSSCPNLEKIHIVAHSRGTDVIASALRELFIEARAAGIDPARKFKIGNLILAAPDLDIEVVVQRFAAERFYLGLERMTIYVSKNDKAIGMAEWLFSSKRRLGQLRIGDLSERDKGLLRVVNQTDIINADVDIGLTGHYYFYLSPAVSSDLILTLRDNLEPGENNGRPLAQIESNYWQIDDSYPNVPDN